MSGAAVPNVEGTGLKLKFGVELEFFFFAKELTERLDEKLPSRKNDPYGLEDAVLLEARNFASEKLRVAGITHIVAENRDAKSKEDYKQLVVKHEGFEAFEAAENHFGMELATCIYEFQKGQSKWQKDLENIFSALVNPDEDQGMGMHIESEVCSTQVHVSPIGTTWSLDQLKKIAKAAIFFERCIDALMPNNRLNKALCRSNHSSIYYQMPHPVKKVSANESNISGKETQTKEGVDFAIDAIDKVPSIMDKVNEKGIEKGVEKLVALMCTVPKCIPPQYDGGCMTRNFRWNFLPVIEKDLRGTIEFRQAPGSKNADEAIAWTMFVLGFVQSAVTSGVTSADPSVDGLKKFVIDGMKLCGYEEASKVEVVFKDKTDILISEIMFHHDSCPVQREGGSDSSSQCSL